LASVGDDNEKCNVIVAGTGGTFPLAMLYIFPEAQLNIFPCISSEPIEES